MELEEEIEENKKRIENKASDCEIQISKLERKIKTYTNWAWSFVVIGFAVGLLGLWIYCFEENYKLNLLGDFYGGSVASFWSLAGLFFIYVAFLGQKQQLLNQQMEIMYSQLEVKYTQLQLKGQKLEMIKQNKTLRLQKFENTFFQLLRNHNDIVNGIDIRSRRSGQVGTIISQGRDCFKEFYISFKNRNRSVSIEMNIKIYLNFYEDRQSDLGHYFRNLYHVLKFIDNSEEINDTEKFKYSGMLRALLSSYELSLLFYNALSKFGVENFKPLIERYSFLKNIDDNLLVDIKHKDEYNKLAFVSSRMREKLLRERE